MMMINSEKLVPDNETLLNGKPVLCKETEINGELVQEFHIPTRDKNMAISIFFKKYFFPDYSYEELMRAPGRPITVWWKIKRNAHRTYVIKQELGFGMV